MTNVKNFTLFKKDATTFQYNNLTISVPMFITRSASKYRYDVKNNTLERQCSLCKKWFTAGSIIDNELLLNDDNFRIIGPKSGLDNKCKLCTTPLTISKNGHSTQIVPLHLQISKDIKDYYRFMAFKNEISLKDSIEIALTEYMKNHNEYKIQC